MKTSNARKDLETKVNYLAAVHAHTERLLSRLAPVGLAPELPEWLLDPERAQGSPFAINLQMTLEYLRGDAELPAVELPDLLQAVHEVVDGVPGCEFLSQVILDEHRDLSRGPLVDPRTA